GFQDALAAARETAPDAAHVAGHTGLDADAITTFYQWFRDTEKVVTCYSQGVNQSSAGTDKVNSLINCHLATGRIGRPGMGPFSLTGQPNAMGGREVGGLANQLAAHMDFAPEDIDRVGRFWQAPTMATKPGLKTVDLFEAVHAGRVKAVWIMATNPVVSLPDADRVKQALAACDFVVVSDCVRHTDTTELAHVLLPALGWGEKDGTVTNSERRISRQRRLLPPPGEARPDWWIITHLARRMGFREAFSYESARDIFIEHAALSGFENTPTQRLRDFDISGLAHLSPTEYDALQPLQWPVTADAPQGTARLFTDQRYFTPSGKACLVAITPRPPVNPLTATFPLSLNTGRIRDQWHTMSRTGLASQLNEHRSEPFVEVHPEDAKHWGLRPGEIAVVSSPHGRMLARVEESAEQLRGSI